MAKLLKLRRGTTTQHGSFTGAEGEVTVDTTKDTLVVHDGSTQSGHTLLREDMSNLPAGTIDNADVSNSAAIAGTKISPDFGSQDITTTGHITLPDQTSGSGKIKLGTGNDLQIYHNGTRSEIINNTGDLIIQASANNNLLLRAQTGETHFKGQHNGQTELYYDGSRKLHTRADAVNIIGDLDMTDADNYKINLGVSSDLQIYHDGGNSWVRESGTGALYIDSNGAGIRITKDGANESLAHFNTDGGVELYYDNSLKLDVKSWGVEINGDLGLDDNRKVALGNGPDLLLYHDGAASLIENATGNLALRAKTAENSIVMIPDDKVALFYDNVKKFETFASGTITSGNHQVNGTCYPGSNNSYDLGTNASRWRNIYTNDLNLSNKGSSNDVDGTWGDWTIQEGENDLFLKNNRSGKKYKFNLTEVS